MKLRLDKQAKARAEVGYSTRIKKILSRIVIGVLSVGALLCLVVGVIVILSQNELIPFWVCLFGAPIQAGIITFLLVKEEEGFGLAVFGTLCFTVAYFVITLFIFLGTARIVVDEEESARRTLVNELIIEQGYENLERHDEKIHFAEKDGTEYILIVNEVEVDGDVKFEVTPFEKGANEDLN